MRDIFRLLNEYFPQEIFNMTIVDIIRHTIRESSDSTETKIKLTKLQCLLKIVAHIDTTHIERGYMIEGTNLR